MARRRAISRRSCSRKRMHAAELDVLIDLRGYGGGSVAETLALRPAPVQVNWLAYPGTSGAPWIDYVIADRVVLPDALRAHFSEAVAYLPRCFQPSDPTRVVGEPPSRAACGLPADGAVFVSFNNSYKLNPRKHAAHVRGVARACRIRCCGCCPGPKARTIACARRRATNGIDPARLVFMPKLPHDEYLARYRHADLFLDTAPYNAHTTASDAIWAGCPGADGARRDVRVARRREPQRASRHAAAQRRRRCARSSRSRCASAATRRSATRCAPSSPSAARAAASSTCARSRATSRRCSRAWPSAIAAVSRRPNLD